MPTLEFKGKHIVYGRHLNAPYRLLDVDRKSRRLSTATISRSKFCAPRKIPTSDRIRPRQSRDARLARENAGYPDIKLAAAALNMGDTDMLRGWESGHKKVTLTQAKKLAHKYRVSLPALYLKSVPDHFRFARPRTFAESARINR